jgi:aldehyde dehydrogenase (NAD+)
MPSTFTYTIRQPLGVAALITPWNFPWAIPCWKIAPALVAGNTVVLKPASATPKMAVEIVRLFEEAGLPPGVLNLVLGSGGTVGDALVTHPAVRAVSFTGSNDVGTKLYAAAAARQARCTCEMGGKNPAVVMADADLTLATEGIVQGAFGSTGQRCTATSRVIVDRRVAGELTERLVERTRALKVGDGANPATDVGPLVDEAQLKSVLHYIGVGKEDGAKLLIGGTRLTDGRAAKGHFVAPTIFGDVTPSMRIAREEVFGPVLAILAIDSFEEAVSAANAVDYGLTSAIYSNDPNAIMRFVDRSEVGIVHVNSPTVGGEAQLPFGGTKATGTGWREMSEEGIHFFTEPKTVYFDYSGGKRDTNIY